MRNYKMLVEGLLFLTGETGLTLKQIAKALAIDEAKTSVIIEELQADYQSEERALSLVNFGGQYKLVTKDEIYEIAKTFFAEEKTGTLSQSALETLAIIAYKQPITRIEIEEIRGVGCEVMLKKLVARELIEEKGRLETVGKPILYQVTKNFMDLFKLQSLEELPKFEDMLNDNSDLFNLEGE